MLSDLVQKLCMLRESVMEINVPSSLVTVFTRLAQETARNANLRPRNNAERAGRRPVFFSVGPCSCFDFLSAIWGPFCLACELRIQMPERIYTKICGLPVSFVILSAFSSHPHTHQLLHITGLGGGAANAPELILQRVFRFWTETKI